MPKKIDLTNTKQKLKRAAPWIVAAASVGTSIAIYRHYDTKMLLEVPNGAWKHMIETEHVFIYCTDLGDFALCALPADAIHP